MHSREQNRRFCFAWQGKTWNVRWHVSHSNDTLTLTRGGFGGFTGVRRIRAMIAHLAEQ
jgi:hypothetical protein